MKWVKYPAINPFMTLKLPQPGWIRRILALISSIFVSTAAWAAPSPAVLDGTHAGVRAAMGLQREATADLMKSPEVLGTAIGLDESGAPALVIYFDRDATSVASLVRSLPPRLRGIAMRSELTDKFVAYPRTRPGGGGVSHTALQPFPIQLGTSGGWRHDLANGFCCGGTLGSLVQVNGVKYIMSNYHVFESDIVSGGNNMVAMTGSFVVQPGLIDVNCDANGAQNVGTLMKLSSLPDSNVDVSVAQANAGAVAADGSILEIGPLSTQIEAAFLRQNVKKSGRTSGLTRSRISGLNATISVTYENECAGGTAFTKTFSGQIVIANNGNKFLRSGDSGSLMVEDVATNPRAVGLLYAGSSTSAIANPINEVLQFLGTKLGGTATMVGN